MSRVRWIADLSSSPQILTIVLLVEVVASYILKFPLLYNFNAFAFWDSGTYLNADYLLRQGHQPFSYFGWQYGLLPLFIQKVGFGLLGTSPASFLCLSLPCFVMVALVMGQIALLEGGMAGRFLLILSLPLILAFEPDLPHSLEPALLSLGVLSQAKKNYGMALAFSTAACFTKPSMGYLYGFVLLLWIFRDQLSRHSPPIAGSSLSTVSLGGRFRSIAQKSTPFFPAACTALFLSIVLSSVFGWGALLRSLVPISGAQAYHDLHFGWSGSARELIYFPGVRLGYYLGTPVGFWTCATIYLLGASIVLATRARGKNGHWATAYETVLTCAVLHLGFIAFFYGSPASWTYYAYLLIAGIIATETTWSIAPGAISTLCVLAALANYTGFRAALNAWRTMQPSPATAGLFSTAAERAEWTKISSATRSRHPLMLTQLGGAQVLFGWLNKPTVAFLIPGVAIHPEIKRELLELRSARAVIVPTIPQYRQSPVKWMEPEFQKALARASFVFKGNYFEVYERRLSSHPQS